MKDLYYSGIETTLSLINNPKLESLNCGYNSISKIDLSNNPLLRNLYCENNKLKELDISNNHNIIHLTCFNNTLTNLNLSNNINTLDLSNNINIKEIHVARVNTIIVNKTLKDKCFIYGIYDK